MFEEEKSYLLSYLDNFVVGSIEHVGSTSVQGMVAKPFIDIMCGVQTLDGSRDRLKFRDLLRNQPEIFEKYNVANKLLSVSKCPDFVVNKGHYFGTEYLGDDQGLSDDDKHALIEFLKTM